VNQIFSSLVAGLIFGAGLAVSGMTQADKVINFLDLTDNWDPSLMFVMVGAIGIHLVLFRLILQRESPLFATRFGVPSRTDIDMRLVGGSAIFGIGWAVGGYCPGPGLVSMAAGGVQALAFVAALTAGMLIFHVADEAYKGAVPMKKADSKPQPEPTAHKTERAAGELAESHA